MTKRKTVNLTESEREELTTKLQEQLASVIVPAVCKMLEEKFPGELVTYSVIIGQQCWLSFYVGTRNKLRFFLPLDVAVTGQNLKALAKKLF